MLDHDDDVVDQQPDRGRDAAEGHDVEAHAEDAQHQHRGRQCGRYDDDGDERHAPAAQEQEEHQRGEHEADQHSVTHARDRLGHQLALIVPVDQPDPGRQLHARQLYLHLPCDLDRVAVRLLVDVEQYRGFPVLDDPLPDGHGTGLHGRDIPHPNDPCRGRLDDDVTDLRRAGDTAIGNDKREPTTILDLPDRTQHVAIADSGRKVRHGKAVACEPLRVREYLDLRGVATLHTDPGETGDRGQQRGDLKSREILELGRIRCIGYQGIGDDRENGRVHPADIVLRASRQRWQDAADRGVDQQRARDHVAPPTEVDRDLRRPARRLRADVVYAGDGADCLLDRAGDSQRGLVGGAAPRVQVDHDPRKRHLREEANRQR